MSGKALLKAVSAGRPRQVRLLLDSGATVDDMDDCGQTSLIRAIFIDNDVTRQNIIKMLLRKDALVSKVDVVGRNALAWASLYGRDKDVRLLLDNADIDLDLNKVDINGQTALFHAVSSGNAATVKLLVEVLLRYDLTADMTDHEGFSPLMHAYRLGHDVCASILINFGKAKIGLGTRNSKDFKLAKIWVEQNDSKAKNRKTSEFPPIVSRAVKYKIKFRENLASMYKGSTSSSVCSDFEDDCITDSDSSNYSEDSIFDNDFFNSSPVRQCLNYVPYSRIPSSILAISPSTSIEAVVSSDDEIGSFSTPLNETFALSSDINTLYGMKQDQISSSYRVNANSPSETIIKHPVTSSSLVQDSRNSTGNSDEINEVSKWMVLKKNGLLSKKKKSKLDTNNNSKPASPQIKDYSYTLKLPDHELDIQKTTCLPSLMDNNLRK